MYFPYISLHFTMLAIITIHPFLYLIINLRFHMTVHDVVHVEYQCVLISNLYHVSNTWIVRIETKSNFTSLHKSYYRIIVILQAFHILLSTQKCILLYFHSQRTHAYCTSHYPVTIACPLAHLLFSWLPFLCHLSFVACCSEWMHW